MYFIKYHPLKEKLRDRSLTDREALPYLALCAAITALAGSVPFFDGYNFWDGLSAVLSVITAIGGVLYAYRENGGRSGYDLIQKYVVLGWVVFVRFLVVYIPACIVLGALGVMSGLMPLDATGPYDVTMILLGEVIYCQRVGRHIRDTKNRNSEQSPERVSVPAAHDP